MLSPYSGLMRKSWKMEGVYTVRGRKAEERGQLGRRGIEKNFR
jgi:hypothetical protein